MSLISSSAKVTGSTSEFYSYPIEQSLRFDGSSYLSQTFSNPQTSNQNMTWSLWVKKSRVANFNCMFSQKGGTTASQRDAVYFDSSSDQLLTTKYTGSTTQYFLKTNQVFRDLSAWFHLVYVLDLDNGTQSERLRLYINGVEVTQFDTETQPANTTTTSYFGNNSYEAMIGQDANVSSRFFSGYLANIQFIDGQALDQYFFGEFKDDIWVPKEYTGSYGTNGFHLDFADSSNIGNDVSGNNNDWTVN
jgi:hypothetical protein